MKYRQEIDGLRALAVLAVILFHANLLGLTGGYVGVDIFFVISGYLITSIIVREIEKKQFSIIDFYERRARRILPALSVVLLLTTLAAFVFMPAFLLESYAKSLVSVAVFCSNIFFYLTSGYFATASDEKPLLHTWSLAVEEQYYVFFPLMMAFLWFLGRRNLTYMMVALSILSLLSCHYLLNKGLIDANFYLIFSRAWELFAGSLIALTRLDSRVESLAMRNGLSLLGLILIVYAIFGFDENTPFPSIYGLVPVLGAVMIIAFSNAQTWVGQLLSKSWMVGVGLISYSLYLWHQPIFAFLRLKSVGEPRQEYFWAGIVVSMLLAYFSYKFIETPFRNKQRFTRKAIFTWSGISLAVMLLVGGIGVILHGLPQRYEQNDFVASIKHSPKRDNGCHTGGNDFLKPAKACQYFGQRVDWASFGDSHTVELAYALAQGLEPQGSGLVHLSFSGCPPALRFQAKQPGCTRWVNESLAYLEGQPEIKHVLLGFRYTKFLFGDQVDSYPHLLDESPANKMAGNFAGIEKAELREKYWSSFEEIVTRLLQAGKDVYVVYPVPELPVDIRKAVTPFSIFDHQPIVDLEHMTTRAYFDSRNAYIINKLDGLPYGDRLHAIKPVELLCSEGPCPAIKDGKSLYFDDNHLSVEGARVVIQGSGILKPQHAAE